MNDLEMVFSMLGEAATTEIARNIDAQGFPEDTEAAQEGGTVAGNARKEPEAKSGRQVVTHENFPSLIQSGKEPRTLEGGKPVAAPTNPRPKKG